MTNPYCQNDKCGKNEFCQNDSGKMEPDGMLDESKYTKEYFAELVEKSGGNCSELAILLGVSYKTVYRWRNEHTRIPKMVFMLLELLLSKR